MAAQSVLFTCVAMIEAAKDSTSIWLIPVATGEAPSLQQISYLDCKELERANAFHFDKDRWLYIKAHACLRSVLGALSGQMPWDVLIDQSRKRKPFLPGTHLLQREVFFNMSHTEGCVAIATSSTHEVGVDVERIRPTENLDRVLPNVFHSSECDAIQNLAGEERLSYFYRIWTMKEAYTKALGLGLSHSFEKFSVELNDSGNEAATILDSTAAKSAASGYSNVFKYPSDKANTEYALACVTLGNDIPIAVRKISAIYVPDRSSSR